MSKVVVVRDAHGEHERDEADFPLSIGRAASADLRLPGRGIEDPVAYLGMHEGTPFVQPADSGIPVFCNERLVEDARWLDDGDTLRIETARITCELAGERMAFRVSDGAPARTEGPVLVVPPPVRQPALLPEEPEPEINVPQRVRPRATPGVWLASAAGALLLALGWFLLSAVSIEIRVDPEPETLEIEGPWLTLAVGDQTLVRPGQHEVVATLPGYYEARLPIEVTSEDNQSFFVRLQRLPGLLTVVTGEVEGSSISANGRELGTTPLVDAELEAGVHTLLVESARYLPESVEVAIEGGGIQQRIDLVLTPAWSPFAFESDPPGAALVVDGEPLGTTPLTVELLAGEREVEIALPDYETWYATLRVLPNQPLERRAVALALADATLRLSSRPSAASVTVDGRFRGRTPLDLAVAPGVPHRFELFKHGHERAVRELSFEAGESKQLDIALVARRGEVEVQSEPADAELFVDGRPRGSANQTLRLSAGSHELEIRKPGYASYRVEVTPSPGIPEKVFARLKTLDQAEVERLPRVVTTSAGQQLRLIDPGRFEMGADRREQGRRSNEVKRSVVLTRPFYLSTREVSNAQFRAFAPRHSSGLFDRFSLDEDTQPAVRVSWEDAARYCNWLSRAEGLPLAYLESGGKLSLIQPVTRGYRLPTEAEWVWAARFEGGAADRKYPWGDDLPPSERSGNYADTSASQTLPNVIAEYHDGFPVSAQVGSFPANALGIHDLGGNVSEWVSDFYAVSQGRSGVETDPTGAEKGRSHVVRGSSWQDSSITELRWAFRDHSPTARNDLGFRIARYAE